MTLSKLASLANVSLSVVSKAFSGKEGVSEAMREHVYAVAREHGCFEKFYHARYDKPVIAVIIPEAISKYYIRYVEALKKDLEENGYTMLLSISNFDTEMLRELVCYYTEHSKVDGLIVVGGNVDSIVSSHTQTAVVSMTGSKESKNVSHVHHSLNVGLTDAVKYLYSNGHRRIAYIGEELVRSKGEKLKEELRRLGLEIKNEWIYTSCHRFEQAGEDGVRHLFADTSKKMPTAIIGAYGYITQGIISELERMGLCVPDDVSVISMDSDPFPLHPTIDVCNIPSAIEEVCAEAMRILGEQMGKVDTKEAENVTLPSSFYIGNSVKKCTVVKE